MSRQSTQPVQTAATQPAAAADGGVARSTHLDGSLDRAHRLAVGQRHAGVSSEHLLFALTEDPEALVVLGASTVNVDRLRADIGTHLGQLLGDAPAGKPILPNADLVKVLKLAAMAAQQSARKQIDGAIVLAAMIGDASTPSAGLLRAHGLTFNEVIRVLQKAAPQAATAPPTPVASAASSPQPEASSAPKTDRIVAATTAADAVARGLAVASNLPPPQGGSTDDLLASVRARLQQSAPAKAMSADAAPPPQAAARPVPPAAPPESSPPRPLQDASAIIDPPTMALNTAKAAPPLQMPPVSAAPPAPEPPRAVPRPAAEVPRAAPPLMADTRMDPRTAPPTRPVAGTAVQPPLPLVPASGTRNGPPPLPTLSSQPSMPQPQPASQPPMPPPMAPHGPGVQRAPPIPPPSLDLRHLMAAVTKDMRQGETTLVEITVPRRTLEIPMVAGHRFPPLRVATMRLRAAQDAAHVELASPETLWISPPRVHQGAADDATWRWRVTPRVEGPFKLTLSGATRIVGGEGISGEVPLGEEAVEIDVMRRGSRRGFVGLLLFGNLIAIGFLAMILSGRVGEMLGAAWGAIRGMFGG